MIKYYGMQLYVMRILFLALDTIWINIGIFIIRYLQVKIYITKNYIVFITVIRSLLNQTKFK